MPVGLVLSILRMGQDAAWLGNKTERIFLNKNSGPLHQHTLTERITTAAVGPEHPDHDSHVPALVHIGDAQEQR